MSLRHNREETFKKSYKFLRWVFAEKLFYSGIHFKTNIQRSYREFSDDFYKHLRHNREEALG